ncbi:hypothetical protein DL96DRAFT_1720150 [Flagelloscypha sp. PMI_526]|nr:hypothetical protein DL96DRAFT_1720150 [Flagelloscypha sp. PMI_526]
MASLRVVRRLTLLATEARLLTQIPSSCWTSLNASSICLPHLVRLAASFDQLDKYGAELILCRIKSSQGFLLVSITLLSRLLERLVPSISDPRRYPTSLLTSTLAFECTIHTKSIRTGVGLSFGGPSSSTLRLDIPFPPKVSGSSNSAADHEGDNLDESELVGGIY